MSSRISEQYLKIVCEASIRDYFMTVYHLADEIMDGGVPFILEPNVLQQLVAVPNILSTTQSLVLGTSSQIGDKLPDCILSPTPWRRTGVKYTANEIYLDLIEEVDAIIDGQTGMAQVIKVSGRIAVDCQLSGTPDLLLKFSQPSLLDDVAFHPSVRLSRFEREKVVSFIPPDGKFTLLEYRTGGDLRLPLYVKPQILMGETSGTVHVMVGSKHNTDKNLENISVIITFDPECSGPTLTSKTGEVQYNDQTKSCVWSIKSLAHTATAILEGTFQFDSKSKPTKPTVQMGFRVTGWTASGLSVHSLTLTNETYNHFKGVKLVTVGGDIEIRNS